jgi:hypothetical protein
MPRPSRTDGLPDSVRRVLIAELNKTQHDQIQLLKSIDSKLTVAIAKLHNLGVETTSREKISLRLVAILSELLEAPTQTQGEALAVVKDFLFNVTKKKK